MDTEDKIVYFFRPELKSRGWTNGMIDKFMPEHDAERYNPYFKRAGKMKLYEKSRVMEIEAREDFKEALSIGRKRREIYLGVAVRKRREMIEWVMNLNISIPSIEKNKLIERACRQYNEWNLSNSGYGSKYEFEEATPMSNDKFLARICTNYLRHKCTSYERHLNKMFGKVGVREGHDVLQARINDAIHEMYPWTVY